MSTITKFKQGDRVYVDPEFPGVRSDVLGRVFIVRKVNKVNVQCDPEDGGRGINYPAESLVRHVPGVQLPAAAVLGKPYVPTEFFTAGEIVTLKRAYKEWTTETPLVVLQDKVSKVNVTKLGGADDLYLRVGREGLERRDLEWLKGQIGANA